VIVAVFKIMHKISFLVFISFINMKGRGKSKPKKKTISSRKSHDHSLGPSLELVNTQTDVVTDNLSAVLGTGHAVSEVSLSRRHHRPAGPE